MMFQNPLHQGIQQRAEGEGDVMRRFCLVARRGVMHEGRQIRSQSEPSWLTTLRGAPPGTMSFSLLQPSQPSSSSHLTPQVAPLWLTTQLRSEGVPLDDRVRNNDDVHIQHLLAPLLVMLPPADMPTRHALSVSESASLLHTLRDMHLRILGSCAAPSPDGGDVPASVIADGIRALCSANEEDAPAADIADTQLIGSGGLRITWGPCDGGRKRPTFGVDALHDLLADATILTHLFRAGGRAQVPLCDLSQPFDAGICRRQIADEIVRVRGASIAGGSSTGALRDERGEPLEHVINRRFFAIVSGLTGDAFRQWLRRDSYLGFLHREGNYVTIASGQHMAATTIPLSVLWCHVVGGHIRPLMLNEGMPPDEACEEAFLRAKSAQPNSLSTQTLRAMRDLLTAGGGSTMTKTALRKALELSREAVLLPQRASVSPSRGTIGFTVFPQLQLSNSPAHSRSDSDHPGDEQESITVGELLSRITRALEASPSKSLELGTLANSIGWSTLRVTDGDVDVSSSSCRRIPSLSIAPKSFKRCLQMLFRGDVKVDDRNERMSVVYLTTKAAMDGAIATRDTTEVTVGDLSALSDLMRCFQARPKRASDDLLSWGEFKSFVGDSAFALHVSRLRLCSAAFPSEVCISPEGAALGSRQIRQMQMIDCGVVATGSLSYEATQFRETVFKDIVEPLLVNISQHVVAVSGLSPSVVKVPVSIVEHVLGWRAFKKALGPLPEFLLQQADRCTLAPIVVDPVVITLPKAPHPSTKDPHGTLLVASSDAEGNRGSMGDRTFVNWIRGQNPPAAWCSDVALALTRDTVYAIFNVIIPALTSSSGKRVLRYEMLYEQSRWSMFERRLGCLRSFLHHFSGVFFDLFSSDSLETKSVLSDGVPAASIAFVGLRAATDTTFLHIFSSLVYPFFLEGCCELGNTYRDVSFRHLHQSLNWQSYFEKKFGMLRDRLNSVCGGAFVQWLTHEGDIKIRFGEPAIFLGLLVPSACNRHAATASLRCVTKDDVCDTRLLLDVWTCYVRPLMPLNACSLAGHGNGDNGGRQVECINRLGWNDAFVVLHPTLRQLVDVHKAEASIVRSGEASEGIAAELLSMITTSALMAVPSRAVANNGMCGSEAMEVLLESERNVILRLIENSDRA